MGKKVYLADTEGFGFFICEYDGLGADNKPRLTVMMPGKPVVNYLEYMDYYGEDPENYYLLCEEGKQADAAMVVGMMGQMFLRDVDSFDRMTARMELMRRNGIDYGRDLQKLTIRVIEVRDDDLETMKYRFDMYVGEEGHFVSESNYFEKPADFICKLRGFFYFVEDQMHIPLRKCLVAKAPLDKQFKRYCPSIFDEIEANNY